MRARWLVFLLVAGSAAPAAAQNDVSRRTFQFFNDNLVIEVLDHTAGVLRVVRGGPGQIDVAARAAGGFTGFGLAGVVKDRLRLSSLGNTDVEYLVIVPENVRVQVATPDTHDLQATPGSAEATFRWTGASEGEGGLGAMLPRGMVLTYVNAETPQVMAFADVKSVRSLEVRLAGSQFGIASSVPLVLRQGDPRQMTISLGDAPPIDLLILVPRDSDFNLRVGRSEALASADGELVTNCSPVILLKGADGSKRARFTPSNGQLDCH